MVEVECGNYPPYHYELALMHLQTTELVPAATASRRGFCANPYIAEPLCGMAEPARRLGVPASTPRRHKKSSGNASRPSSRASRRWSGDRRARC